MIYTGPTGTVGSIPHIVVEEHQDESPVRGDPGASGGSPDFHGAGISETTENYPQEKAQEGNEEVSGRKAGLSLNQDQEAENPFNTQDASVHPELEHTEDAYEDPSSSLAPYRKTEEQEQEQSPQNHPSHPPPRASDSVSAAAASAKHTLRRATTSMRESVKQASARVAYAGEKVGQAWNKTLDSTMIVCVICGGLAIILVSIALSLRSWRYQNMPYDDANGHNVSRVDLGLGELQRIQYLDRSGDAGEVVMYDRPYHYDDVMTSAYCIRSEGGAEGSFEGSTARTASDGAPGGSPAGGGAGGEPSAEGPGEGGAGPPPSEETSEGAAAEGFLGRLLQAVSPGEPAKSEGPLADPPPFSITLGRDPKAPGSLDEKFVEMRDMLLGPTALDIHCRDLKRFKNSGILFTRMMIAYLVFAGIGFVLAIFAIAVAPMTAPWTHYMRKMPINLVGTVAWVVALVMQLIAFAAWGVGTDVAACVTPEGGATVCNLGAATALMIASLVLTLIAALCFCVFFTHRFIRDLGLEKDRERELREVSERRQSLELAAELAAHHPVYDYPGVSLGVAPKENAIGYNPDAARGDPRGISLGGPRDVPLGGPREGPLGGPHPQAEGESNSPIRSITEDSHAHKGKRHLIQL